MVSFRRTGTFGGVVRDLAALAVAASICAGLSFGLVRYVTRDLSVYRRSDDRAMQEALALRTYSRTLAELSGEWFQRAAADGSSQAFRTWLEREFQPRLNDLRQQIVHAGHAGEAFEAIRRAADALNVSASTPQDESRRRRAAELILEGISVAERRVMTLDVDFGKLPPPVPAPEDSLNRWQRSQ